MHRLPLWTNPAKQCPLIDCIVHALVPPVRLELLPQFTRFKWRLLSPEDVNRPSMKDVIIWLRQDSLLSSINGEAP